jgi:hypothetical protein
MASLDTLADIELQLCMHGLAPMELLQLAQCSRRLHHAADSPFAWKHTRLLLNALLSPVSPFRRFLAPDSAHLLRHAPLALRFGTRTCSNCK